MTILFYFKARLSGANKITSGPAYFGPPALKKKKQEKVDKKKQRKRKQKMEIEEVIILGLLGND